jgi:hypothetical protein
MTDCDIIVCACLMCAVPKFAGSETLAGIESESAQHDDKKSRALGLLISESDSE